MKTAPLRLVIVVGVTLFIAMRLMGWLQGESEPRSRREGTAVVSGIVVDDHGTPLSGAHVFITADDAQLPWTATAQGDGRFRIEKLPAGTYQLGAAREGHLGAYFAQAPPRWGVTKVALAGGAALDGVEVRLPRAASVEGVVRDVKGAPIVDHEVRLRAVGRGTGDAIVAGTIGVARTDAQGRYRIDHLDAGEYAVIVRPRAGAATVLYYPGVRKLSLARTITVARGEARTGVDVSDAAAPVAAVDGVVKYPGGKPPARLDVLMFDADAHLSLGEERSVQTDAEGRFHISDVPAGRFTLVVQATIRPADAPASRDVMQITRLSATETVATDGRKAATIALALEPGVPVSGRLIHPRRADPVAEDDTPITIRLAGADALSRARLGFGGPEAKVAGDGSFRLLFVPPGRFTFLISDRLPASIDLNGAEVIERPVDVGREEIRGITIAVTERAGEINGIVRTADGKPSSVGAVVLFPADARLRKSWLARVRIVRPDTSGRFVFADLPAGQHLVAALASVPFGAWDDTAFLDELAPLAARVELPEAGVRTLELTSLQTFNKTERR